MLTQGEGIHLVHGQFILRQGLVAGESVAGGIFCALDIPLGLLIQTLHVQINRT